MGADGLARVAGHKDGPSVAIESVLAELRARGESFPLILRFPQIIEDRLERLNGAFHKAAEKFGYRNGYQGVFPIKVNQRRVVVETIAEYGARFRTGLEAGSKAELALCLVQDLHPEALLCCNGFKDDDFVRLALWGRKLGKNVVITLEKLEELERVLRISQEVGVEPAIGVRFKLHARGSGPVGGVGRRQRQVRAFRGRNHERGRASARARDAPHAANAPLSRGLASHRRA